MSVHYDPSIIQTSADALYKEADVIVRDTMIKYGISLLIVGLVTGAALKLSSIMICLVAFLFALVGALVGKSAAQMKAFKLRLKAQTALCQVEIEKNSRKTAEN